MPTDHESAPRTGRKLGIPYDLRRPSLAREKQALWNPADPRLVVPKAFGWGWSINVARLLGRHAPRG